MKNLFNGDMKITLSLENYVYEQTALEALIWGLKESQKQAESRCKDKEVSLVAMSAYGILEDIKKQYPEEYKIVIEEYNEIYK